VLFVTGRKLESRDIVDGHRQKTLQLLWTLIFVFKVSVIIVYCQASKQTSSLLVAQTETKLKWKFYWLHLHEIYGTSNWPIGWVVFFLHVSFSLPFLQHIQVETWQCL